MKPYIVKYETLKKKAKESITTMNGRYFGDEHDMTSLAAPLGGAEALIVSLDNGKPWRDNLIALRKAACDRIEQWDIRCISKLIELFPSIIPKRCQNKPIHVFMADNENCDWMVQIG